MNFTIDTTAPSAPSVSALGSDTTSPYITAISTPVLTGTGEPNTLVTLLDGSGNTVATGMTDGSGNYSITLPSTPDGSYNYSVTNTDALGNTSAPTALSFAIDTLTPASPTITSPLSGALLSDSTPTLTGTGEPNTTFTVRDA
jgi:large repetitive protein